MVAAGRGQHCGQRRGLRRAVASPGGGEARPFASQTAAASPSRPAAPSMTGRPGPPQSSALTGSFLMDLTWVSDQRGWALAALPCARGLCPRVTATGDGGRSWTALPIPPGVIQDENGTVNCAHAACVSQIRFATTRVGYLFGPALFQTDDGGRSWHRVPSRPVEAFEPSAGTVVRVVYDHTGCPGPCTRMVQETAAGSDTWHTLLRISFFSSNGGVAARWSGRAPRSSTSRSTAMSPVGPEPPAQ